MCAVGYINFSLIQFNPPRPPPGDPAILRLATVYEIVLFTYYMYNVSIVYVADIKHKMSLLIKCTQCVLQRGYIPGLRITFIYGSL